MVPVKTARNPFLRSRRHHCKASKNRFDLAFYNILPKIAFSRSNMKLTILAWLAAFIGEVCSAQTSDLHPGPETLRQSEEAFRLVEFSVVPSTNSLTIGTTNLIQCKILNGSTNTIFFAKGSLTAYLTNSTSGVHDLIKLPERPPHRLSDISPPPYPDLSFGPHLASESRNHGLSQLPLIVKYPREVTDWLYAWR